MINETEDPEKLVSRQQHPQIAHRDHGGIICDFIAAGGHCDLHTISPDTVIEMRYRIDKIQSHLAQVAFLFIHFLQLWNLDFVRTGNG